ncbi:MAG: hypothetical protein CTY12_06320 [Methylotenera sp.]|nr:MAG: hypothetical protein CTY12_06320 [Methylotenera sp.]
MLYTNDTTPTARASILGLQGVFDWYSEPTKIRKELLKIGGRIILLANSRELIYGVLKRQEVIGYLRLIKSNNMWMVSEMQMFEEFSGMGIMSEVFLTALEDTIQIVSNSTHNDSMKFFYLRFVEKHQEFGLFSIDLDTNKVTPFDYNNPEQYWDGRENIRIMIKPNPVVDQVVPV